MSDKTEWRVLYSKIEYGAVDVKAVSAEEAKDMVSELFRYLPEITVLDAQPHTPGETVNTDGTGLGKR